MNVKKVRMVITAVTLAVSGSIIGYGLFADMSLLDTGVILCFAGFVLAAGLYALLMFPEDDD